MPTRTGVAPVPSRPMRVLVVEDEVELADAVARGLRKEGYAVDVANDGNGALDRLAESPYDLSASTSTSPTSTASRCADACAPSPAFAPTDGESAPRVLMLTARDSVTDRVGGLDVGADDYLVKPFAFSELAARVRTLLRRDAGRSGARARPSVTSASTRPASRPPATAGSSTSRPRSSSLLRYFMSHAGEVLSQERLLEHVWDENADPFTNTVRVTVGTLRRKLAKGARRPGDRDRRGCRLPAPRRSAARWLSRVARRMRARPPRPAPCPTRPLRPAVAARGRRRHRDGASAAGPRPPAGCRTGWDRSGSASPRSTRCFLFGRGVARRRSASTCGWPTG